MAIAHIGRRSREPEVFERPSNMKALKKYPRHVVKNTLVGLVVSD